MPSNLEIEGLHVKEKYLLYRLRSMQLYTVYVVDVNYGMKKKHNFKFKRYNVSYLGKLTSHHTIPFLQYMVQLQMYTSCLANEKMRGHPFFIVKDV